MCKKENDEDYVIDDEDGQSALASGFLTGNTDSESPYDNDNH